MRRYAASRIEGLESVGVETGTGSRGVGPGVGSAAVLPGTIVGVSYVR